MKIQSPALLSLVNKLIVFILRMITKTTRFEFVDDSLARCPFAETGSERFLYSVWHDSVVAPIFGASGHQTVALISQHRDADTIEEMLKAAGLGAIRGSTSRGGASAVKKLLKQAEGKHVVITPDGPRGPHHKMKPGIIFLASHSGRSVVPTAFTATRYWEFKGSWTSIWIPKPFSKIYFLVGHPIHVPEDLTREELRYYTELVQEKMEELDRKAKLVFTEKVSLAGDLIPLKKAA
ncbi:hypothetical protein Enr10x_57540 [Gimesia panareensis]|uniref:DUF374 domain-containing protein n=1 Tax=Gimesia panareensis TaxID=2527978 RepID=A0A517QFG7_9PLAN|nr:lysophospholipid acyltransferase family protein [Gimesia panareensis]QDT30388.1 hypothetical protein Enr10x_57540 [Gimesia panareensis]